MKKRLNILLLTVFAMLMFCSPAYANWIFHAFFIILGVGAVLLGVVIVLVEACIYHIMLKTRFLKAFIISFAANLVTTVLGFSLGRYILKYSKIVSKLEEIPLVQSISIFIAAFLITCIVEYVIVQDSLKTHDRKLIKKAVIFGNAMTYAICSALYFINPYFN